MPDVQLSDQGAIIKTAYEAQSGAWNSTKDTKLTGIAAGATVNSPDATLLARANHTGSQATSTITGLDTALAGKQPIATVLTNTTASFTTALETKLSGIATGAQVNVVTSATQTDFLSGLIATAANQDYMIVVKAPYAGTILETTTRATGGTATGTFKINTTNLGGTANSISSTEQSRSHASANAFSAGDDIVLTISSNSSAVNVSFTIRFTRTLT